MNLLKSAAVVFTMAAVTACTDDSTGPLPPAGSLQFSAISAGYFQSCGLTIDGRAFCWGMNDFGTLGDGTRISSSRPRPVATSERFTTIDSGAGHTCALTANGTAFCWGRNDEGQVGDGTFIDTTTPVPVATPLRFQSISAGHAHSCGLTAVGEAYCWGDDIRGQLGDGPNANGATKSASLVLVNGPQWKMVVAGYYQTCGLAVTGEAYCWGANDFGQNGDGTTTNHDVPVAVQGTRSYDSIAPGDRFVCAVSTGSVYCWGANRFGELASDMLPSSPVPLQVPGISNATSVFTSMGASTVGAAQAYACAISQTAKALCWGGSTATLRSQNPAPVSIADALNITSLALGPRHLCAVTNLRYAYCGGTNANGQLGDGTTTDRAQLVPTVTPFPPD